MRYFFAISVAWAFVSCGASDFAGGPAPVQKPGLEPQEGQGSEATPRGKPKSESPEIDTGSPLPPSGPPRDGPPTGDPLERLAPSIDRPDATDPGLGEGVDPLTSGSSTFEQVEPELGGRPDTAGPPSSAPIPDVPPIRDAPPRVQPRPQGHDGHHPIQPPPRGGDSGAGSPPPQTQRDDDESILDDELIGGLIGAVPDILSNLGSSRPRHAPRGPSLGSSPGLSQRPSLQHDDNAIIFEDDRGRVYHLGDNAYPDTSCAAKVANHALDGHIYEFHFTVREANTEVQADIQGLCGVDTPGKNVVSFARGGSAGGQGMGTLKPLQTSYLGAVVTLQPGEYVLRITSDIKHLSGGRSDRDDFTLERVVVRASKAIDKGEITTR